MGRFPPSQRPYFRPVRVRTQCCRPRKCCASVVTLIHHCRCGGVYNIRMRDTSALNVYTTTHAPFRVCGSPAAYLYKVYLYTVARRGVADSTSARSDRTGRTRLHASSNWLRNESDAGTFTLYTRARSAFAPPPPIVSGYKGFWRRRTFNVLNVSRFSQTFNNPAPTFNDLITF